MLNSIKIIALVLTASLMSTGFVGQVSAQTIDELQQEFEQAKEDNKALVEEFEAEVQEKADQFMEEEQSQADESEMSESQDRFLDSYDRTLDVYEDSSENVENLGDFFAKLFVGGTLVTLFIVSMFALFGLAGLIFNIVMIVDCAKGNDENKAIWLVAMGLGLLLGWGWVAAIIYYFVSRGSDGSNKKSASQNSDGTSTPTVSY